MSLDFYLFEETKKYENVGDFVYYNFDNEELMGKIVNQARDEFHSLLHRRKIQKSYVIYLALVYIQMKHYSTSFWDPVREHLNIYDRTNLSNQNIDVHLRKIIDRTRDLNIEAITRQSTKVQFDAGISFPHLTPLYEICYDYYYFDLGCGVTESDFQDESEFLLEGLRHKFYTEELGEDEITINSKVYRIIVATKLRILYSTDMMVDLIKEILKMIDSFFWESIVYTGNHFIKSHFDKWASNYISAQKKLENHRNYINKVKTDHIVRKPNLFFYSNEIYFKVPDQKFKIIDESKRTKIQFNYDNLNEEFEPSVKRQMIGYLLSGYKVLISNPFISFGYKIYTETQMLYEKTLELCDFYMFDEKTGRRIHTLKNYTGRMALITRLNVSVFTSNAKVIAEFVKDNYKITLIDIEFNSVLLVEGQVMSSYEENESGILVDKMNCFSILIDDIEYTICNSKPLLIIPEDYKDRRLLLRINGKNYSVLNEMVLDTNCKVYDFSDVEFVNEVYNIEVIDLSKNNKLYEESFYYNENLLISLDKDLYYIDEIASVTISYQNITINKYIKYKSNEVIDFAGVNLKIKVTIPYILWEIEDLDLLKGEVFLEQLPTRCLLKTKNLSNIDVNYLSVPSNNIGEYKVFDLSALHNMDMKEVSVYGTSSRGETLLFKVFLKEFIDKTKTFVNYNDSDKTFEGHVEYVGFNPLFIIIKDVSNQVREQVIDGDFKVNFTVLDKAVVTFVKAIDDEFGLFGGEDIVLYKKVFKIENPNNFIDRVLLSETKITNIGKKNEMKTTYFSVKIKEYLGDNIYRGLTFLGSYREEPKYFRKYKQVRVKHITSNNENEDYFIVLKNDDENMHKDWKWRLEKKDYEKRKI